MPAPLSDSALEAKRGRILEAARRVCYRSDLDSAKMADIAAEAKVSKGTLYRFFQSKEDLLLEMVRQTQERFIEEVDALFAQHKPDEQFDRFVDLLIEQIPSSHEENRVSFQALAFATRDAASEERLNHVYRSAYERSHELVKAAIERAQAAGVLRKTVDASASAICLSSVADGLRWRCSFDKSARNQAALRSYFQGVIEGWRSSSSSDRET